MNWIAVTIIAAFFQNLRFTLQKNINKKVSTVASTYVRFLFALPFCIILFFGYFQNIEIIFKIIANENKFILYFVLFDNIKYALSCTKQEQSYNFLTNV